MEKTFILNELRFIQKNNFAKISTNFNKSKMINIHTKNISISEDQEQRIHGKLEKLLNYARRLNDESTKIKAEIDYDSVREKEKRILCTITIYAPSDTLRAETSQPTVDNAIDECEKKLKVQIEKYKAKHQ